MNEDGKIGMKMENLEWGRKICDEEGLEHETFGIMRIWKELYLECINFAWSYLWYSTYIYSK